MNTAVVTGAARGIGLEISSRLIAGGWSVAGCDILGDELESAATGLGEHFRPFTLDITDSVAVNEAAGRIGSEMGPVTGLVSNAGITRDGLLMRMEESDWDDVIRVNLKGAYLMTRAFLRGMMKARSGSIVYVSSVVALLGQAGQTNYAASKAGLLGLTRALTRELAPRNIRVNAVVPGFIETDMTRDLTPEVREDYASRIPMSRMGMPIDVAEAVAFLLGDSSTYITGVVLPIDGGLTT
jgi:3-oxoacyl-[acyl-carrier protein] reductase